MSLCLPIRKKFLLAIQLCVINIVECLQRTLLFLMPFLFLLNQCIGILDIENPLLNYLPREILIEHSLPVFLIISNRIVTWCLWKFKLGNFQNKKNFPANTFITWRFTIRKVVFGNLYRFNKDMHSCFQYL